MGLISKIAKVKLHPSYIEYYKSKGYDIPMRKASKSYKERYGKEWVYDTNSFIEVKVEDLPNGSHAIVEVQCDVCGNIYKIAYRDYNKGMKCQGFIACKECVQIKVVNTVREKYGVENTFQSEEIKERIYQINKIRYGVKIPTQNNNIMTKIRQTMMQNDTVNTSIGQRYINHIIGGTLNGAIGAYNCDILFDDIGIDFEYDGGGHNLSVKMGYVTDEEFQLKELIRDKIIKKHGYKIVRFISLRDRIPSDDKLIEILNYAIEYFKNDPERTWIIFDVDNSCIYNKYHQVTTEGLPFDFGEIKRIRSDRKI